MYYAQPPLSAGALTDRRSGAKTPPSVKLGTTVLFAIVVVLGRREGARPVLLYSVTQAWAPGVSQADVNKGYNKFLNEWAVTTHASAPGYNDAAALMTQLPDKAGSQFAGSQIQYALSLGADAVTKNGRGGVEDWPSGHILGAYGLGTNVEQ